MYFLFLSSFLTNSERSGELEENEDEKKNHTCVNGERELFIREEFMSHLNNVEFQKVMKAIFQNFGDTLIINNRATPPKFYRNFKELTITGYESEALD